MCQDDVLYTLNRFSHIMHITISREFIVSIMEIKVTGPKVIWEGEHIFSSNI